MKLRIFNSAVISLAVLSSSIYCMAEDMEYKIGSKVYSIPDSQRDNIDEVIDLIDMGFDVSGYGISVFTLGDVNTKGKASIDINKLSEPSLQATVPNNRLVLFSTWNSGELNNYDQPFDVTCPKNMFIRSISSYHNNNTEDRIFSVTCGKYKTGDNRKMYRMAINRDANWANSWDEKLNYTCSNQSFMVGIHSYHNNHTEDRRFKFDCASMGSSLGDVYDAESCKSTGTSLYDRPWTLIGDAVIGMDSTHNNDKEDRITSLRYCQSISDGDW